MVTVPVTPRRVVDWLKQATMDDFDLIGGIAADMWPKLCQAAERYNAEPKTPGPLNPWAETAALWTRVRWMGITSTKMPRAVWDCCRNAALMADTVPAGGFTEQDRLTLMVPVVATFTRWKP